MNDMWVAISICLAVGISTGIASGQKQARKKIRGEIIDYTAANGISITDLSGASVPVEQFATDICGDGNEWPQWRIWAVVIGLGAFFATALIYYFMVKA